MKRIKEIYQKCIRFSTQVGEDHVGAYAAQSAFFFMLSMIPIILLLLMLVRYTPVTKADVMTAVIQVFPRSVDSLITSIVNQVYNQSMGVIPVTVIVALWSAGKGVLAVTSGLNCVYECPETRNYVFLRVRATLYTLMFLLVIVSLLILSVFGNTLNLFIADHIPFMTSLADWLIQARIFITPDLQVPSQPEGQIPQADPGSGLHSPGVDGDLLDLLRIRRRVPGLLQYVREPDHHCADHAVDVFLHVQYPAGRGAEYRNV